MNWTIGDFVVAFLLISFTIAGGVWITKMTRNRSYRFLGGLALLLILGVVWTELAVGIFD